MAKNKAANYFELAALNLFSKSKFNQLKTESSIG